ncbi:MAG: hypothetical protein ABIE74_03840 [Pseudomonadota bacterium]
MPLLPIAIGLVALAAALFSGCNCSPPPVTEKNPKEKKPDSDGNIEKDGGPPETPKEIPREILPENPVEPPPPKCPPSKSSYQLADCKGKIVSIRANLSPTKSILLCSSPASLWEVNNNPPKKDSEAAHKRLSIDTKDTKYTAMPSSHDPLNPGDLIVFNLINNKTKITEGMGKILYDPSSWQMISKSLHPKFTLNSGSQPLEIVTSKAVLNFIRGGYLHLTMRTGSKYEQGIIIKFKVTGNEKDIDTKPFYIPHFLNGYQPTTGIVNGDTAYVITAGSKEPPFTQCRPPFCPPTTEPKLLILDVSYKDKCSVATCPRDKESPVELKISASDSLPITTNGVIPSSDFSRLNIMTAQGLIQISLSDKKQTYKNYNNLLRSDETFISMHKNESTGELYLFTSHDKIIIVNPASPESPKTNRYLNDDAYNIGKRNAGIPFKADGGKYGIPIKCSLDGNVEVIFHKVE